MRPIRLKMSAFNSYAGVQEINFSDFGSEGLFLITGPTGSGKTTIFDGIMYALFGTACSRDRSADMVRSLVCEPTAETSVELEFEAAGQTYTIFRSPRYRRKAKRGKGEITSAAKTELKMPDGSVLNKVGEVEQAIQTIIGLDKNQFRQVALLAQGDFRQILTGDTSSRMKILRSLFGTDRYEKLEEKLKEKRQAAMGQEAALQTSIDASIAAIEKYPRQPVFDWEDFASWNGQQKERLGQLENSRKNKFQKLDVLSHTIGQLEQKKKNWDAYQKALQEEQYWKPRLEAASLAKKELDDQKPAIDQIRVEIQSVEKAMEAGRKKETLEKNVNDLIGKIESVRVSAEKNDQKARSLEALQKEQQARLGTMQALEEKIRALHMQKEQFTRIQEEKNKLEKLDQQARQSRQAYQQSQQDHSTLEGKLNAARAAYLEGQAGILAQTLVEHQPCPVCGATDHPNPAQPPAHTPTQKELDTLNKTVSKARKQLDDSFARLSEALQQVRGVESSLKTLESTVPADSSLEQVCSQIHSMEQEKKEKEQLEKRVAQETKQLEELAKNKEKLAKETESLEKEKNTALGQIQQLSFPFASMQEARQKKEELSQQCRSYDQALEEAVRAQQEALKKRSAALGILESMDASTMEDVSGTLENTRQERASLQAHLEKLEAQIKDLEQSNRSNLKIQEDLRDYMEKHTAQVQICTELKELNDALNGASNLHGQGRLDLETYVQAAYYEQVLEKANLRLLGMSDGRYQLQRRQEASGNSRIGLDLDILDRWNMKVRPASGLSGGESFMASLSLALGLSDAIMQSAGGSALDTLFVDEGFGSLDADALSKAIGTLYTLAGNRLVGIISHVESIKQNVEAQIVVSQDKDGKSHAKVIA